VNNNNNKNPRQHAQHQKKDTPMEIQGGPQEQQSGAGPIFPQAFLQSCDLSSATTNKREGDEYDLLEFAIVAANNFLNSASASSSPPFTSLNDAMSRLTENNTSTSGGPEFPQAFLQSCDSSSVTTNKREGDDYDLLEFAIVTNNFLNSASASSHHSNR
jgi:hypothetical protein